MKKNTEVLILWVADHFKVIIMKKVQLYKNKFYLQNFIIPLQLQINWLNILPGIH